MTGRQKAILVGMVLGDAFLQRTGENNARIRLEHSKKQKDYLIWKARQFPEYFQGKPNFLTRFNGQFRQTYSYVRWQSNASPEIGKFRKIFYNSSGKKLIPPLIKELLIEQISLAVWYMDDGYLYHRDKMIYIYLSKYTRGEQDSLLKTLKENFNLSPRLKIKKTGSLVLIFPVEESKKFLQLVSSYIIPSMTRKLLDPVTTEGNPA